MPSYRAGRSVLAIQDGENVVNMQSAIERDERNDARDARTLAAAVRIVETRGLSGLTRDAIADEAGLSAASVSNFGRHRITNGDHDPLGYRTRILRAMMDQAIERADVRMIRIGLADGCLRKDDVPPHMRAVAGV